MNSLNDFLSKKNDVLVASKSKQPKILGKKLFSCHLDGH
jgi:hypothetical protein